MLLLYFRYHTMRYRFDAEGIHMRWGILMRHEVMLNYSRIQDIQLRSNVRANWHTGTRPIRRVHRTRRGSQRVGPRRNWRGVWDEFRNWLSLGRQPAKGDETR